MENDFYIMLPSNTDTPAHNITNTPAHFKIDLPIPLEFSEGHDGGAGRDVGSRWECGLAEIIYPFSWPYMRGEEEIALSRKTADGDRDYLAVKFNVEHFRKPIDLIDAVNSMLSKLLTSRFRLENFSTDGGRYRVRLSMTKGEKIDMLSAPNLLRALGFVKNTRYPRFPAKFGKFAGELITANTVRSRDIPANTTKMVLNGFQQIFVYCDLVRRTIVGSGYGNLLRVINANIGSNNIAYGESLSEKFNPIHYIGILSSNVQTIEVKLADPLGNLIEFDSNDIIYIKLHIRRRRQHQTE
jgi:hypothetical protein